MTQPNNRTPPLICEQILALYAEGASQVRISEELGPTPATIRAILRAAGVHKNRPQKTSKMPAELQRNVIAMHKAGHKKPAIMRKFGIGRDTVDTIIKAAGLSKKAATINDHPKALERCAEMMLAGSSLNAASRRTNTELGLSFSPSTYSDGMLRHGLRARPSSRPFANTGHSEPAPRRAAKSFVEFDGLIIRKTDPERYGVSLSAGCVVERPASVAVAA